MNLPKGLPSTPFIDLPAGPKPVTACLGESTLSLRAGRHRKQIRFRVPGRSLSSAGTRVRW